jgi:hypothetical protein
VWTPVFEQLDRSVLSAWASGPRDVYLVGGGLGVAGAGAIALHYDGRVWRELPVGRTETLWWVWGRDPGTSGGETDVWMVGEQGLVLRWDGERATVVPSGTEATLFGVWGSSPQDVWVVGGKPVGGMSPQNDVALHWDGQALARDGTLPPKGAALFKVWGSAADDVWVSGEMGTLWRWTASGWQDHASPSLTRASILTVHGCSSSEVYAVGGRAVLGFDGTAWRVRDDVPPLSNDANGVSCGSGSVLVTGNGGLKLRLDRASGTWTDDQAAEPWMTDFHGALVTPGDASLWAVGGNFLQPSSFGPRIGVVGYFGCSPPPSSTAGH